MNIKKALFILAFLLSFNLAFASDVLIDVNTIRDGSGVYTANLMIDTGSTTINTIEGLLNFDSDKLNVEKIITGKSIVKAWIIQPESNNGKISFSGIIPGGFKGTDGNIFQVFFSSNSKSETAITASIKTLLNDGLASNGQNSSVEERFNVVAIANKEILNEIVVDTVPPKILQSVISQNDAMFDGNPFIVVSAKDEESGVSKTEIAIADVKVPENEIKNATNLNWQEIQSPSVLPEDFSDKYVYTRVIDREGNYVAQLVSIPRQLSPENLINRLKDWWGFGILIVLVFGIFLAIRRFLRRHGATNSSTI